MDNYFFTFRPNPSSEYNTEQVTSNLSVTNELTLNIR